MNKIEYPIKVNKINYGEALNLHTAGGFVKVRPCGEEYENKTYLGLFLGDLPVSPYVSYDSKNEELDIKMMCNPAMYIFDLNKIIYGYESWWSRIENENDLNDITDADIKDLWYIKALKTLK
jgi:hypothetical protein